ncbi:LacI family DNA-binding transcriptional regulator [Streptomyces sp. MZ04]|uniref:LacI family DNA-binding transcriptional regulator n=1 Tax=Streptomyces sp. MZ04 TaxID=2559236 RepID=UPI001FD83C78|nr:LacI family DNA-binding transcriptional regulator [Streptomyces sp. MZ04]
MTQDAEARTGRRPTLEDVAAHAGVSRALVSLVVRGAPGASAKTRDRVLKAAAELGYRRDARARLLASNRSELVGVVFGMAGTFHFELLDGLYAAAEGAGYELILSALTPGRDERRAVETLLDFRCEALILLGPETPAPEVPGELPVVVVGWRVKEPSVDVVRTSDDEGMRQAVDHLVALGHRQIAHIDGGRGPVSVLRRRGYRAAMRRHGLGGHLRVVPGGQAQDAGAAAARTFLETGQLPTAVIAYNDDVATGLLESFIRAGVAVPDDVSIVGWDDSRLARLPHVDLTTVGQDAHRMAGLALARALARLEGREVSEREIVLAPHLVVRGTTAAVAGQKWQPSAPERGR